MSDAVVHAWMDALRAQFLFGNTLLKGALKDFHPILMRLADADVGFGWI
jgi:hypothetical protein